MCVVFYYNKHVIWTLFYCTIIIHSKKQTNRFKSIECETNPNESVRSASPRPCRGRARPWAVALSAIHGCTNPETWPTVWIDKRSVDISFKLPIIDQRWRQRVAIVVGTGVIKQNANSTRTSSEVWSDKSDSTSTHSLSESVTDTVEGIRWRKHSKVLAASLVPAASKSTKHSPESLSISSLGFHRRQWRIRPPFRYSYEKNVGKKRLYCKIFQWWTAWTPTSCPGCSKHVAYVTQG